MSKYKQLEGEIVSVAKKAAKNLIELQDKVELVKNKDIRDIATNADLLSEKLILSEINKLHPDHNILSEEIGFIDNKSAFTWIIDPLDETHNYFNGLHNFNCLIAIEENNVLVAGVTYLIGLDHLFEASLSGGSYLGAGKLRTSSILDLESAKINLSPVRKKHGKKAIELNIELYKKLVHSTYRTISDLNDASNLAFVASGSLDAYVSLGYCGGWWDVAPGILLVKEAGGKVTDFFGNEIKNQDLSKGLIVSNGLLHEKIINLINIKK